MQVSFDCIELRAGRSTMLFLTLVKFSRTILGSHSKVSPGPLLCVSALLVANVCLSLEFRVPAQHVWHSQDKLGEFLAFHWGLVLL